jgi:hypothetical protein
MKYVKPELIFLGSATAVIQAHKVPPNGPDGLRTEINPGYEPEEQD